jgi:hypothetical protein
MEGGIRSTQPQNGEVADRSVFHHTQLVPSPLRRSGRCPSSGPNALELPNRHPREAARPTAVSAQAERAREWVPRATPVAYEILSTEIVPDPAELVSLIVMVPFFAVVGMITYMFWSVGIA